MKKLHLTDPGKIKAATTYNSAAEHFDDEPLGFWARTGRRTVERLELAPGAHILDVGCGTGASALPAAEKVGPTGKVTGVDLAERLLELAHAKAAKLGLQNVEFRPGDMTALGYADGEFDCVVSVFSIFFVPDMEVLVAELWRMVKPGGKLAITTWGPRIFAPVYEIWRESIRAERPDLYSAFNPWDRITTPEKVTELMQNGGVPNPVVVPESGSQPLQSAEDWWIVVLGSGLRATVDAMDAAAAERIHHHTVGWTRDHGVTEIETNVIYAIGSKAE